MTIKCANVHFTDKGKIYVYVDTTEKVIKYFSLRENFRASRCVQVQITSDLTSVHGHSQLSYHRHDISELRTRVIKQSNNLLNKIILSEHSTSKADGKMTQFSRKVFSPRVIWFSTMRRRCLGERKCFAESGESAATKTTKRQQKITWKPSRLIVNHQIAWMNECLSPPCHNYFYLLKVRFDRKADLLQNWFLAQLYWFPPNRCCCDIDSAQFRLPMVGRARLKEDAWSVLIVIHGLSLSSAHSVFLHFRMHGDSKNRPTYAYFQLVRRLCANFCRQEVLQEGKAKNIECGGELMRFLNHPWDERNLKQILGRN